MQAIQPRLALLHQIIDDFSGEYTFKRSQIFSWSSENETVYYSIAKAAAENAVWSLLHEIGHASLHHKQYHDDLELLIMEVAAWKKAKEIAARYYLVIDDDHIQDCLDSYRNWLHTRSRCIECQTHSFQINQTTYQCYNCLTRWKVPASRLCNPRKTRIK